MSRLKELREKKGITQQDLADRLHVTESAVSYYETGKRQPRSYETIRQIAEIFDISVAEALNIFTPEKLTKEKG